VRLRWLADFLRSRQSKTADSLRSSGGDEFASREIQCRNQVLTGSHKLDWLIRETNRSVINILVLSK